MTELEALAWCREHDATVTFCRAGNIPVVCLASPYSDVEFRAGSLIHVVRAAKWALEHGTSNQLKAIIDEAISL